MAEKEKRLRLPVRTGLARIVSGNAIVLACALTLAGCTATPAKPAFYAAPESGPSARIAGSAPDGDPTAYVTAVDGLPIDNAGAFAPETRVVPGYRALTILCLRDALRGSAEITAHLEAGHSYRLKAGATPNNEISPSGAAKDALYDIWLEDSATHEIVGGKHLAKLNVPHSASPASAGDGADAPFWARLAGALIEGVFNALLNGMSEPARTQTTDSRDTSPQAVALTKGGAAGPLLKTGESQPNTNGLPGKLIRP